MKTIKALIIVAVLGLPFNCFEGNALSMNRVSYQIIKDQKKPNIKRSVDVRINQRVTVERLKSIAMAIKETDYNSYERTFILYYLSGQVINSGAWASSHFNPKLEIKIVGLSLADYQKLIKSVIDVNENDVIGQWYESLGSLGRVVTIYRSGTKVIMSQQYKDGSTTKEEAKVSNINEGLKIEVKKGNSFGEYYLINKKGSIRISQIVNFQSNMY